MSLVKAMGSDWSFAEVCMAPKAGLSFTSTEAGSSERWFSVDFTGEAKGLSGRACSTLPSWHLTRNGKENKWERSVKDSQPLKCTEDSSIQLYSNKSQKYGMCTCLKLYQFFKIKFYVVKGHHTLWCWNTLWHFHLHLSDHKLNSLLPAQQQSWLREQKQLHYHHWLHKRNKFNYSSSFDKLKNIDKVICICFLFLKKRKKLIDRFTYNHQNKIHKSNKR